MAVINALPYLHALGDGGPRSRTQVVVVHATDGSGTAAQEADYATRRPDKTSAHFYVDDTSAYRALPLDHIAYGCLPHGNSISVQLELCGRSNQLTDATMRRAAPIVAEICATYGLPVVKLTAAQVRAGTKGICGHADITAAFPEDHGDHTDPGSGFNWPTFLGYVHAATNSPQEDDMSAQAESVLLGLAEGLPTFVDGNGKTQTLVPVVDIIARQKWQASVDQRLTALAAIAAKPAAGAPTQDQVNTAVLAALKDPAVQAGIGAAIASHIKVA